MALLQDRRRSNAVMFAARFGSKTAVATATTDDAIVDADADADATVLKETHTQTQTRLRVESLATAGRSLPVSSYLVMDTWVCSVLNASLGLFTDVGGFTVLRRVLDDALAASAALASETHIVSVIRSWLAFRESVQSMVSTATLTTMTTSTTTPGAGGDASAEGVALDTFLSHAETHAWFTHRDGVFTDDGHGVVTYVAPVRDCVLRVLDTASTAWVREYLLTHLTARQRVVEALSSGVHSRFPLVVLDSTTVAFDDVVVRMTSMGLRLESTKRLCRDTSTRSVMTPRAYVPCTFGTAHGDAAEAVSRLFPRLGRECILRTLGAVLQPRAVRHGDRWVIVCVAVGPMEQHGELEAGQQHPVVWLLRTFVGLCVVTTLAGVNVSGRPSNGLAPPMVLLLHASASGTLTPDQQSQILLASVSDIVTVIRAPYVPTCISMNEGLRLSSIVVDVPKFPTKAQYDAALPHVLPVLLGAYGVTPFEKRQMVTPIFDKDACICRVEAPMAQTACTLFGEMLQSGFGVRMVANVHADFTRVRAVFNDYQMLRGYVGFASTTLSAEDVLDAAAVVCTHFPCLKPSRDAVQWARSSESFVNLALLK